MDKIIAGTKIIRWQGNTFVVTDARVVDGVLSYKCEPKSVEFEAALRRNWESTGGLQAFSVYFSGLSYCWFSDDAKRGEK